MRTAFPYRHTLEYRNHDKLGTLCYFQTSVKSKYSIHVPIVHKYKVRASPGRDESYRLAPRKLHLNTIKYNCQLFILNNINICRYALSNFVANATCFIYYKDCNISFKLFFLHYYLAFIKRQQTLVSVFPLLPQHFRRVHHERHRPVVDQRHPHVRAESSFFNGESLRTQRFVEREPDAFGVFGLAGGDEARSVAFADVAVEREL